eukprot:Rhum_TRINITY_DN15320_c7_g2::Rhum_TRINITY_DN15320_c7_g2_i9::g.151184::m.151184
MIRNTSAALIFTCPHDTSVVASTADSADSANDPAKSMRLNHANSCPYIRTAVAYRFTQWQSSRRLTHSPGPSSHTIAQLRGRSSRMYRARSGTFFVTVENTSTGSTTHSTRATNPVTHSTALGGCSTRFIAPYVVPWYSSWNTKNGADGRRRNPCVSKPSSRFGNTEVPHFCSTPSTSVHTTPNPTAIAAFPSTAPALSLPNTSICVGCRAKGSFDGSSPSLWHPRLAITSRVAEPAPPLTTAAAAAAVPPASICCSCSSDTACTAAFVGVGVRTAATVGTGVLATQQRPVEHSGIPAGHGTVAFKDTSTKPAGQTKSAHVLVSQHVAASQSGGAPAQMMVAFDALSCLLAGQANVPHFTSESQHVATSQ